MTLLRNKQETVLGRTACDQASNVMCEKHWEKKFTYAKFSTTGTGKFTEPTYGPSVLCTRHGTTCAPYDLLIGTI